jgi:hypothetical protein
LHVVLCNFDGVIVGQPRKPELFKVQPANVTSGAMGVQWEAGYNGGYELDTFELQYHLVSETEWVVYEEQFNNIGHDKYSVLIHPLKASATYHLRVRAINKRPSDEGDNFSLWTWLMDKSTTGEEHYFILKVCLAAHFLIGLKDG